MRTARGFLTGLALGTTWAYFFDPQSGNRRRSILRDQVRANIRRSMQWFDKALRDLAHRIEGGIAEIEGLADFSTSADSILVERIRARLGHVASHPRLIEVECHEGCVTLKGHAPAAEIDRIVLCATMTHGVRSVDSELDSELGPEVSPPSRKRIVQPSFDLMRENWAPGTRLIAGSLATALMANCAVRRTPGAIVLGTLGFGLMLRTIANRDIGQMIDNGKEMARPILDRLPNQDGMHRQARGRTIEASSESRR